MANRSWARTPLPAWTPCLLPLLLTDQQGLVVLGCINRMRMIEDQMDGVGAVDVWLDGACLFDDG